MGPQTTLDRPENSRNTPEPILSGRRSFGEFRHHSICHMIGNRPVTSRDKSANFWPLAILSMGESWHSSHHADPTSR